MTSNVTPNPAQQPTTLEVNRRVRLPAPRKVLAKTLQRLEKLVQSVESGQTELKPGKLTELVLAQGKIALALHREKMSAERKRLAEENSALKAQVTELKKAVDDDNPWSR
jgi:hypothetical protein